MPRGITKKYRKRCGVSKRHRGPKRRGVSKRHRGAKHHRGHSKRRRKSKRRGQSTRKVGGSYWSDKRDSALHRVTRGKYGLSKDEQDTKNRLGDPGVWGAYKKEMADKRGAAKKEAQAAKDEIVKEVRNTAEDSIRVHTARAKQQATQCEETRTISQKNAQRDNIAKVKQVARNLKNYEYDFLAAVEENNAAGHNKRMDEYSNDLLSANDYWELHKEADENYQTCHDDSQKELTKRTTDRAAIASAHEIAKRFPAPSEANLEVLRQKAKEEVQQQKAKEEAHMVRVQQQQKAANKIKTAWASSYANKLFAPPQGKLPPLPTKPPVPDDARRVAEKKADAAYRRIDA